MCPNDVQASISGFWNAVAPQYEQHPGNTVVAGSETYGDWVELFRSALPTPPADVLDVCTGTGFTALICASLGHRAVGIDLAERMLEVARAMARDRGLAVTFVTGDAVAPGFPPETFDVLTCRHTLWTLRNANTAIEAWYHVLRRGGRVVAMDSFHAWQSADAESPQDHFFRSHYTDDVRAAIPFMDLHDAAPLVSAFRDAGFADVTFELLDSRFGDDSASTPYLLIAHR